MYGYLRADPCEDPRVEWIKWPLSFTAIVPQSVLQAQRMDELGDIRSANGRVSACAKTMMAEDVLAVDLILYSALSY